MAPDDEEGSLICRVAACHEKQRSIRHDIRGSREGRLAGGRVGPELACRDGSQARRQGMGIVRLRKAMDSQIESPGRWDGGQR